MTVESATQLEPAYLRLQADRCERLSRTCMDLGTARDLGLMSEEYFAEASIMETVRPGACAAPPATERRAPPPVAKPSAPRKPGELPEDKK
jgi:hypothetical protein